MGSENMSEPTYCRKCSAEIIFFKSAKTEGKWLVCNASPVRVHAGSEDGMYTYEDGTVGHSRKQTEDKWGYISHWSTCPNAKDFRKKK